LSKVIERVTILKLNTLDATNVVQIARILIIATNDLSIARVPTKLVSLIDEVVVQVVAQDAICKRSLAWFVVLKARGSMEEQKMTPYICYLIESFVGK
jgi:hypothetical protein